MTAAIVQARMSSTRLPGKVMKPLLGRPMLARQIERVRRAPCIDQLVLATSTCSDDDPIAALAGELRVTCYRGSLGDVLDRYYRAARTAGADTIIRLTGDCPLADPELIEQVHRFFKENRFDYASNARIPTYPDGLDVEVFSFEALEAAWREATLPSQREHVTFYIIDQPARFSVGDFGEATELSSLRWTVDSPEDFELVKRVYEELYPVDPGFTTGDILALLEREPGLRTLNAGQRRNSGWQSAFRKDREWLSKNQ
jgi:spore coat polysaccharide biosynthesis protein SpsF